MQSHDRAMFDELVKEIEELKIKLSDQKEESERLRKALSYYASGKPTIGMRILNERIRDRV